MSKIFDKLWNKRKVKDEWNGKTLHLYVVYPSMLCRFLSKWARYEMNLIAAVQDVARLQINTWVAYVIEWKLIYGWAQVDEWTMYKL